MEETIEKLKNWLEDTSQKNWVSLGEEIVNNDYTVDLTNEFGYESGFKVPLKDTGWEMVFKNQIQIKKIDDGV